jgi:hypothetical protein
MEKLEYNKDTLDIIKSLSCLSKAIIFEKAEEGKKILVNSGDLSAMIVYRLEAPLSHFGFNGEQCAFYEFPDFHDLMSILEDCDIFQKGDILTLVSGNTKIKYLTSEPELITGDGDNEFDGVEWSETVGSFTIGFDDLKKINKLKSSIKANSITIDIVKNDIKFTFFNKESENTCEDSFANDTENIDAYTFLISTEIFDRIPLANYTIEFDENGLVRFKMLSEGISLDIYTGQMEEDI